MRPSTFLSSASMRPLTFSMAVDRAPLRLTYSEATEATEKLLLSKRLRALWRVIPIAVQ
jgi:hypothetical protein